MRLHAREEDLVLDRLDPPYILNQAVMHGVISRDEYNFLTNVMKYRNALAHGFKTVDFDRVLVKELISTMQHLLQEALLAELEDGRVFTLSKGMTYHVGDGDEAHRSSTKSGCKLFIVD